jgi:hypothetical protein
MERLLLGGRPLSILFAVGLWSVVMVGCGAEAPHPAPPQRKPYVADPNDKSPVRLAAGTAQPEKTPAGAAMSFSVGYKVIGPLNAAARSLLVIEANGGKKSSQPTQLAGSGMLKVSVHGWLPTDGPFEARIEQVSRDGTRCPLSLSIPIE